MIFCYSGFLWLESLWETKWYDFHKQPIPLPATFSFFKGTQIHSKAFWLLRHVLVACLKPCCAGRARCSFSLGAPPGCVGLTLIGCCTSLAAAAPSMEPVMTIRLQGNLLVFSDQGTPADDSSPVSFKTATLTLPFARVACSRLVPGKKGSLGEREVV